MRQIQRTLRRLELKPRSLKPAERRQTSRPSRRRPRSRRGSGGALQTTARGGFPACRRRSAPRCLQRKRPHQPVCCQCCTADQPAATTVTAAAKMAVPQGCLQRRARLSRLLESCRFWLLRSQRSRPPPLYTSLQAAQAPQQPACPCMRQVQAPLHLLFPKPAASTTNSPLYGRQLGASMQRRAVLQLPMQSRHPRVVPPGRLL